MKTSTLEDEIKRSRQQRWANTAIVFLALLVALLNFSLVKTALPTLNSIGPQGVQGEAVNGIDGRTLTREELVALIRPLIPKISDGKDGKNGKTIIGPRGLQGQIGQMGAPGEPGQPAREIELRHNDEANRTEWRYVGSLSWQVLVEDCEIIGHCHD